MAELSSMPHLDENKNTSTLSNHVPESDDSLHTSTNNGVKNIASEYGYQSLTSVKGNFSEINSNITVLSPKNLNILTTEGGFVKSEVGSVQDSANLSALNETENSFRTANGSILGEANGSFRGLNGSYLEETAKSPNISVKSLLDNTITKVESPTLCLNANTSRQGSLVNDEISFNDAPTSKCASFTEVVTDSQVTNLLNVTSTTSLMGNNSSSPESKSKRLVKNHLDITSTVELPSENQASTEDTPDASTKSLSDTASTLGSLPDNQIFCVEDVNASTKSTLDTTSTLESLPDNQIFCVEDINSSTKSTLDTTSTLESLPDNQIFCVEDVNSSTKSTLDTTSTLESLPDNQIFCVDDKPDTPVKIPLDIALVKSPSGNQTPFAEDERDTSVKSPLLGTSTIESPAANQTSFAKDKPDASVESILGTSVSEFPAANKTSFTGDKPDTSITSLLGTSAIESPAANQTSFAKDKPDSSVESILGTSVSEFPAANKTSFTEGKPDTSITSLLGTLTLESPSGNQKSFAEDKLNISVKSLSCNTSLELPAGNQISFTEEKIDTPIKYHLEETSNVLRFKDDPCLIEEKPNPPVKSLLETTSAELSSVNNASSHDKSDTSVKTLLNTTSKVVSPLPTHDSSMRKQEAEGSLEIDVSFKNASPLPNKSASFTVDNSLINDSLPSNQEVKTNSFNDSSSSALDQAVGSCASTDNSDFVERSQPVETTPKANKGFRNSSRLIDFSRIEDGCTAEDFPFKVPSIKHGSSNTPDQNSKDFKNASELSTATTTNLSSEAFGDGLHVGIAVPDKDPFGICKSDPFDLMGMDEITAPVDDFVFKVPENPANVENEEFTDAVQFFKDPSSFQFLENIKTSQTETNVPRSSLYIKFDPLHSAFPSQTADILQALKNEANLDQLNLTARESLGNILISFDSPRKADCRESKTPVVTAPVKVYTEEELQQHLKVNELTNQEMLLKKQREMEEELVRKEKAMMARDEEKDAKIAQVENLLQVHSKCLEECALVASMVVEKNKELLKKMEAIEEENLKLKGDVKTLTDDLQSVETTFADFHKRYEQCKGMLKTYKDNEELLRTKLKEQEHAYQVLQDQTQESSEKASSEISCVKKVSEAKIAVLEAQLKKAQLKISSLESDIKQIRIENSKLGGICDDLMEKVGNS